MANIIKFDHYFDDQDTPGHTETKFISMQQIATVHLELFSAIY